MVGGSFDRSPEPQAQAAELAVERAKRRVERGGHAAVVVDSLDALPPSARRRVFGAARATEEGGIAHGLRRGRGGLRGAPLGHHPHRARARRARVAPARNRGTLRADALAG